MKLLDVFTSAMLLRKMLTSVTYFGSPNLFICMLAMLFNRVFRQERFNRFLEVL